MGVKVLSLFDGMACGMLAMVQAEVEVERYVAYEIDKYAIQTSSHNFSMIEHRGDVFEADFTEFEGFDFLIGGSPCTYWSIAQKNNRETEASGMGWELFSQYVRALHEAKPRFFIYENNKSMSKAIRASIDEAFGFEAVCINSALASAQNRQRLYWVGKRNKDGTYSKVDVQQPKDRGILLKDVLESGEAWQEKSFAYTTRCQAAIPHDTLEKHRHTMVAEPVAVTPNGKAFCLTANYPGAHIPHSWEKSVRSMVAEPCCVAQRGRYSDTGKRSVKGEGRVEQFYEARTDGKTNAVTTVQKDNAVAEPVRVGCMPSPDGTIKNSQGMRIYSTEGKSVNLTAQGGGLGAKTGLYAIPIEFEDRVPIKAVSAADGKTYPVYEVKDGMITIKGKTYPIKLIDGFYIIRKLTVRECMRLQTVPEWYEFPVSNTQAYKLLGNGWTVLVIEVLIRSITND